MQTFTQFLQEKFTKANPMLLDDDIINAFDTWLSYMSQETMIDYADLYANELINK